MGKRIDWNRADKRHPREPRQAPTGATPAWEAYDRRQALLKAAAAKKKGGKR